MKKIHKHKVHTYSFSMIFLWSIFFHLNILPERFYLSNLYYSITIITMLLIDSISIQKNAII